MHGKIFPKVRPPGELGKTFDGWANRHEIHPMLTKKSCLLKTK